MKPHKPTRIKLGLVAAVCLGSAVCASAQSLAHRYSFNDPAGSSTFVDSVAGANGTLNNDWSDNLTSASLDGSQLQLDGTGGYANLPGGLLTNDTQTTIEFWATHSPSNSVGTHTFGFGHIVRDNGDTDILDYTHRSSYNSQSFRYENWGGWGYAQSSPGLSCIKNIHVTAILDCNSRTLALYNWTKEVARYSDRYVPSWGPRDSLAYLGRSIDYGDPPLNASINEFRIYSGVLPSSQIALNDATGPDRILSSPGTFQALHFRAPTNYLEVGQLSQQSFTGDFTSVTGLDLIAYGGAAFTSLDTNILTISSNGVVQAISGGIAQVVASYGGLNVTNFLSVKFPRLVHRYSFNDPAGSVTFIDSVGTKNGTLNNDVAVNPTSASLDGSQLQLDGTGGYATLPRRVITSNTKGLQVTIEFWASYSTNNSEAARTFAFGNTNTMTGDYNRLDYFHNRRNNMQWLTYETAFSWGTAGWNALSLNGATNVHVTLVVDCTNKASGVSLHNALYFYNGATLLAREGIDVYKLWVWTGFNDFTSLLGRPLNDVVTLNGSINEFRIYSGVLPFSQIILNDASGPDSIVSSPGTLQALHFISPTNYLVVNQISQQALTGDFTGVTGLNLIAYGGASFTSSDPSILMISTNGVVKAVGLGTAEVVASYGGLNATNSLSVQFLPLTVSVVPSSENLLLTWPLANAGCSVQTSTNLGNPNWITLSNVPWLSSSNTWQISIPASGGAQFFRLCR